MTIKDFIELTTGVRERIIGIKSYIQQNSIKVSAISTWIHDCLAADQVVSVDYQDTDVINIGTINVHDVMRPIWVRIDAIKDALAGYLSRGEASVLVYINDDTHDVIDFTELIDRFGDMNVSTTAYSCVLDSALTSLDGETDLVTALSQACSAADLPNRARNTLVSAALALKQQCTKVDASNVLQVLPSLIKIAAPSQYVDTSAVATYSGINALTAIISQGFDNLADAIDNAPTVFANISRAIVGGLYTGLTWIANTYAGWATKLINLVAGTGDALVHDGGNSTQIAVDYSYHYPHSLGSWQLIAFDNVMTKLSSGSVTIPTLFGIFYLQQDGDGGYYCSFKPKVVNFKVLGNIIVHTLGSSMPGWGVHDFDMKLYIDSFSSTTVTIYRSQIEAFLEALASRQSELYSIDWDLSFDARYMVSVYAAQWAAILLSQIMLAYSRDPGFASIDFSSNSLTGALFRNWATVTPGNYDTVHDCFEPTNYQMGVLCCSMQRDNTAFALNPMLDANTCVVSASDGPAGLVNALANICQAAIYPSSVTGGTGFFSPYLDGIYELPAGYHIPSDQENVSSTKGFLLKGLFIAAAVVVTFTLFKVRSLVRKNVFSLGNQASTLAFQAAESGDATKMAAAYALQKKANLMSRLAGGAESIIDNSLVSSDVKSLGKLIDPNY